VALTLSQLLPEATFFVADEIVASGCSDDPAACGPGDVFVARLTAGGDGHDEVARALARGVAGVVAERMIPTFGTPLCIVPDSGWAMARLTHALAGDPARRLRVIAVTGTSGKTTTAWLAASVLSEAGLRVGVLSDLGCVDAESAEPAAADLRSPQVLADWLRRLADGGCTHAIVEVSSRMLAEHALAGIVCDTVVVTNLASAHLDVHGTAAAYRAVKSRILDCLGPQGCLVASADDERVARLIGRRAALAPAAPVITAALTAAADVTAAPVERSLSGQTFLVRSGGHVMPVAVSTPVASFARDSLLATAVGLRYRVPMERIARGLEAAGSVPGRLERIDRGQDHAAFVDHPTSGHALAAALAGLRRLTPGRLVVLAEEGAVDRLATGAGRNDEVLGDFSRRISRWADDCLVVPATLLDEDAAAADIAAYARVDRLLTKLRPEDCLLVVGEPPAAGHLPGDPDGAPASLAAVVDGWLQLAHAPSPFAAGRRAA
jgi:UDP-N-acetylmuramoyl-L-alanyl-D-glutamate--2,6-diaminopimelate ligase